jgi:hypothetical protein
MSVVSFKSGGYRFVECVFWYSAGVAAEPGHRIVRVQFRTPVPAAAELSFVKAGSGEAPEGRGNARDHIVRRGAARFGLTWHYNRPPVVNLEYEIDCRSVSVERVA